jgi:GWxTD domain-containing protein
MVPKKFKIWTLQKLRSVKYLCVSLYLFQLFVGIAFLFSGSCYYYRLERKLNPENADWLNKVRYIITSEERKFFLDLPDSEKDEFKEEFWRRRDPDPQTEENEFKMEFDDRMEKANELFISEGIPGWLTDRGRIFILFGPPTDRITSLQEPDGSSREIWYYGNFPVVFMDRLNTGVYKLVTYNLTSLQFINLAYMHDLSREQEKAQQTIIAEVDRFDFDWEVGAKRLPSGRIEGIVRIFVPYTNLWFKDREGTMFTILDLQLELRDATGTLVWSHEESFEVQIEEEELSETQNKSFDQEIAFTLENWKEKRVQGESKIYATLTNRTGMTKLRKVRVLSIK